MQYANKQNVGWIFFARQGSSELNFKFNPCICFYLMMLQNGTNVYRIIRIKLVYFQFPPHVLFLFNLGPVNQHRTLSWRYHSGFVKVVSENLEALQIRYIPPLFGQLRALFISERTKHMLEHFEFCFPFGGAAFKCWWNNNLFLISRTELIQWTRKCTRFYQLLAKSLTV